MSMRPVHEAQLGTLAGIGAYALWGVLPLFWRVLEGIRPDEILAHRVVWAFVFLVALVGARGISLDLRRSLGVSVLGAVLISINWYLYLYGVSSEQVMACSLGYFLSPLCSTLLGVLLLHERLRVLQYASIVCASIGLAVGAYGAAGAPWLALFLALTFSLYGYIQKRSGLSSLQSLFRETALLMPCALLYLLVNSESSAQYFSLGVAIKGVFLVLSGAVTAIPLLLFAVAARALPLSSLGMLQYLSPALQFLIAVFVFGEPTTLQRVISFGFVLAALGVFSYDQLRHRVQRG